MRSDSAQKFLNRFAPKQDKFSNQIGAENSMAGFFLMECADCIKYIGFYDVICLSLLPQPAWVRGLKSNVCFNKRV